MEALAAKANLNIINPFDGSGIKRDLPLTDSEGYHRTIREISILKAT